MKKLLALLLGIVMTCCLFTPAHAFSAVRSSQSLTVNGQAVICDKYNIDGSNYFKLRDLAALLNGTDGQFDVGWDGDRGVVSISTGHAYTTPNGQELRVGADMSASAAVSRQTIMIDGTVRTDLSVYNIGGSNYFMLRELGKALGFFVDYDPDTNTAIVKSGEPEPTPSPNGTETSAIRPLKVVRQTAELQASDGTEPFGVYWYEGSNVIEADLSDKPGLAYSLTIGDQTRFTGTLPAGYDPQRLLEWGKYPGLNVDILHAHGFTGKGSTIAYIDQAVQPHEQYNASNIHIINTGKNPSSMHGPAVLSLLAGETIGVAPDAEIYYLGCDSGDGYSQLHEADCLYRVIDLNETLPEGQKIRMVGFSDNIDPSEPYVEEFRAAARACEEAGIMVWFCGENASLFFLPDSDRNNYQNLAPRWVQYPELVGVPAGGRTTAATMAQTKYIYWGSGGLSWTMPFTMGLYAIAIEIDPTLTQDALRRMIVDTANVDDSGMRIVNPVGFIAAALQGVGRNAEARAMLDEVKARTKYLYALMDTAAMTEKDLTAVGDYLASITDATVLVADAAQFADAQSLYTALQQDAKQRGGTVAGIQIFGTPSMVPAFEIGYKVQMTTGVDEDVTLLTDLFYGNFNNEANMLGTDYNVMDHMAEGWAVDLIPQWPVVRLPLSKGEFAAFFEKYNAFALETGLERLDVVNFSNPIFNQKDHSDDMGLFLQKRIDQEFGLMDVPYRLYGNQKGEYPVTNTVLGGFEAECMTAENKKAAVEFIINSHGQWNNIDNAIFVNGEEQRISLVNMDNINTVLGANPYYLDAWTCLNGLNMANDLTTTALNGKCVGMFSATAVISNNGVNWKASLSDMAKSNFYYFYYNYLKALHEGKCRSQAFFIAQQEYGRALLADSKQPVRGDGNYQFNLYNLLAYHNFGVIEPNAAGMSLCEAKGYINQAPESVQKPTQGGPGGQQRRSAIVLTDGNPLGDAKTVSFTTGNRLTGGKTGDIRDFAAQPLDNGYTRFSLSYLMPEQMSISVFNPPDGTLFMLLSKTENAGQSGNLIFDLKNEDLNAINEVTIKFYLNDEESFYAFFYTGQLK